MASPANMKRTRLGGVSIKWEGAGAQLKSSLLTSRVRFG
jgi:hypothetical protein